MSSCITLDCLPTDIHHIIISHLSSCRDSVKALRQTGRRFADTCAVCLFSSIHISALTQDQENFLQVAASPHLACHVNTLVWEELTGDFTNFRPENLRRVFSMHNAESVALDWQEDRGVLEDLAAQSKALFWLTSRHAKAEMRRRQSVCRKPDLPFWNKFVQATKAFPNLYTLVSRPMHPDREVQPAADGYYPLTARVVCQYLHAGRWTRNRPRAMLNIGFILYLIPLLGLHYKEGDLRIRKLSFADEDMSNTTALEYLSCDDANAFSNISHLELRVTDYRRTMNLSLDDSESTRTGWAACLSKAAKLTSIHITCDTVTPGILWRHVNGINNTGLAESFLLSMIPTLPALYSASFEEVSFGVSAACAEAGDEVAHYPQTGIGLLHFIKRHASTLRELQIVGSFLAQGIVDRIAADPCIRLDRFVISPSYGESISFSSFRGQKANLESEQKLLSKINRNYGLDDGKKATTIMSETNVLDAPGGLNLCPQPYTHHIPKDKYDTTVSAMDWSVRQRLLRGKKILTDEEMVCTGISDAEAESRELVEHCRVFQPMLDLWEDMNGVLYDPGTDSYHFNSPHQSPHQGPTTQQSLPLPNQCRDLQNDKQWVIGLGLWAEWNDDMNPWAELKRSQSWRLYKDCGNDGNSAYCEKVHGKHDEDVGATTSDSFCELPAACPRNFCRIQEDFEQIVRHERGAKWRFGRDANISRGGTHSCIF
ncbi:hypothetical protein E4U21_004723 [Claviceps maximensis]|nr:hypothetical protein E4U21_004723 [Claviceps maximensis]